MKKAITRRWFWITLALVAAVQLYYVRELLAALLLFGVLFGLFFLGALLLYLVQEGGTRAVAAVEHSIQTGLRASHRTHAPLSERQ